MKTYCYNINGERKFLRAMSRDAAQRKIFFGQLQTNGQVDLTKIDLKLVRDPGEGTLRQAQCDRCKMDDGTLRQAQCDKGNKVFEQLRHL